jgi:sec-independent protein translocase protein TatC
MKVRGLIKDPDAYNDPPRPFFEHIVALRSCIMNAAVAWVICCIIVGVFSPTVLKWLQAPATALQDAGKIKIVSLNLTGGFSQIMSIGMWGGTALAFPAVMYFVLRFVFPALTRREKVAILFFLLAGTAFFAVGVGFAYGQLAPNVVRFFDVVNQWVGLSVTEVQIENYVPLIMKLILAFGLVFQIPLILFVLGWLGVITSDTLRRYRRFAIVLAFVMGMALTPPDPMSQLLMAVPLCLLYEASIWGIWLKEKATFSSSSEEEAAPPADDKTAADVPPPSPEPAS